MQQRLGEVTRLADALPLPSAQRAAAADHAAGRRRLRPSPTLSDGGSAGSRAARQQQMLDELRGPPTDDQEDLTAAGDQASDLDLLVAGAGFEPATSGL